MCLDRVEIFYIKPIQSICEFIKVIFLKVNFKIITAKSNLIVVDKVSVCFSCLQA